MSLVPRKPVAPIAQSARRPSIANNAAPTGGPNSARLPLASRGGAVRTDSSSHLNAAPPTSTTVTASEAPPTASSTTASNLSPHEVEESRTWREPIYYSGQNCTNKIPAPVSGGFNFGFDDERGDYTIVPRDHISYRYEVISMLGKGSFGQVARCIDHKTNAQVAVKIIRNKKRFHTQAQVEVKVLSHLRDRDPEGKYGIIRMLDTFTFRGHVCLTYELLSMNLYEYMKLNKFHPMPLHVVKKIGASLLISLAFMWRENIIHCDLKPENILLRQPNRTGVKVIDLGSACFENERLYVYIQSRFYRAPEVIFGMPYTRRIDLWSYACVLCELATGYPLFPGENEVEQLACIMETFDVPPDHVIRASPRAGHFFEATQAGTYAPKLVPNSRKRIRHPNTRSLSAFLGLDEDDLFVDFVRMFLRWDPMERPPPEPAMRHPWICDAYVGVTPRMPTMPSTARPTATGGVSAGTAAAVAAVAPAPPPAALTARTVPASHQQPQQQQQSEPPGAHAAVPTLPQIGARRK